MDLVLAWLISSWVLTVIGGAIWFELAGESGFFTVGPAYYIGALTMGIWAICMALPHLLMMLFWTRSIGPSERTRLGILAGMLVFALPQAMMFALIEGAEGFPMAYVTVALGLWLPRALLPPLRPGAFA